MSWYRDKEDGRIIGYVAVYAFIYRNWSRFLHRFNYHHVRPSVGEGQVWCHWCGLRGVDTTKLDYKSKVKL